MDSSSKLPRPSGIPRPPSTSRTSSLPRPSKLPVPGAPSSQLRPYSPAPSLRSKSSNSSLRAAASPRAASTSRTNIGGVSRPAARKDDDLFRKPIGRPASRQARSRIQRPAIAAISTNIEQDDVVGDLNGFRTSSRLSYRDANSGEFDCAIGEGDEPDGQAEKKPQKPRSSLTERTLESLSQIMQPTSPTSRQTSWFTPPSPVGGPMGPPIRPASAMSFRSARPASRTALRSSSQRPTTPTLRPPGSAVRASSAIGTRSTYSHNPLSATDSPSQRSASDAPRSPASSAASQPMSPTLDPEEPDPDLAFSPVSIRALSPTGPLSPPGRFAKAPMGASMTMGRIPKTRPSIANTFDEALLSPIENPEPSFGPNSPARTATPARKKAAPKEVPTSPSKTTSSSAALREQIARAKAARKAALNKPQSPVKSNAPMGGDDFDSLEDPFNQLPKGGAAVMKKRIDTARSDGRLNIANMGLSEIPKEVMSMYEYDPDAGVAWSEAVDLVRFIAADNEIERLPEDLFPDIDPMAAAEDDDIAGPQFGGLEMLDLHGNILKELPVGLRRLERLTVLNLSRNRLANDAFGVISQISSLRELKLADNSLEGDLPESIGSLTNLEVLELQDNKLGSLPDSIQELVNLRVLNLSTNRFSSLPTEVLQQLPLVELLAAKNALRGALFPDTVSEMRRLQVLDVSGNALSSLGASTLSMPALQSLNVSINRMEALPDLSGWPGLLSLLVEENKLSEFPAGFLSLKSLKHANFNSNEISKIDPEIGLMESLEGLTLTANPLRERKFLTMATDDMKRDLKRRIPSAPGGDQQPQNSDDPEESSNGIIPSNSMWALRPSGILDLSSKELNELDEENFSAVAEDTRQLVLHHNNFTYIPETISMASNITILDLSNNRLTTTFTDETTLCSLRDLRLAANRIPSFDFLLQHLTAPRLERLDVSTNRISGTLPILRATFPELSHLLASDNAIEEISAEALDGLAAANLSNNNIGRVPPEIGLLADHGLKSLEIEGNSFRVPNYMLLKKGTDAVLAWLRDRIPSTQPPEPAAEVSWEDETF